MRKNNRNRNRNRKRRGVAKSLRNNHSPKRRAIALRIDRLKSEVEELKQLANFSAWFYSTESAILRSRKQAKLVRDIYGK